MKKTLFCILVLVLIFAGCGKHDKLKREFTMSIEIPSDIQANNTKAFKSVLKTPEWWIDKPENGYSSTMDLTEQLGGVLAYAVIRDEFGNVINPIEPNKIIWSSSSHPAISAVGPVCSHSFYNQTKCLLHAVYTGKLLVSEDPIIYEDVYLEADAICLLMYRNTIEPQSLYTQYLDITNFQYVSYASQAELYKTVENDIIYLNAPYGIAKILDREPGNELYVLGGVKKIPDGLTYETKIPLVNYGVYIIKLANGNFTKALIWNADRGYIPPFGLWLYYSISSTPEFEISW